MHCDSPEWDQTIACMETIAQVKPALWRVVLPDERYPPPPPPAPKKKGSDVGALAKKKNRQAKERMTDGQENGTMRGLVLYSKNAKAFCSWHDEMHDNGNNTKRPHHGAIVCPCEGSSCSMPEDQKRASMEQTLNDSAESRQNFMFHIGKHPDAPKHEEHMRGNTQSVYLSNGYGPQNLRFCRRLHRTEGVKWHHDGDVYCGTFVDAHPWSLYTKRKENRDPMFELGYGRTHQLCGVDQSDPSKTMTCRKDDGIIGRRHESADFKIFAVMPKNGKLVLEPWRGIPR